MLHAQRWEEMMISNRGERLQLMLTPEELDVVDEFRFRQRMPTRAAAVRELLKRGLAAVGFGSADLGARSSDFGVLSGEDQNARETVRSGSRASQRHGPVDGRAHGNGHRNGGTGGSGKD